MNISKRSVGITQLLSVFVVMLFTPAVRMLPTVSSAVTAHASWLTPLPTLLPALILLLCIAYIYKPFLSRRPSLCSIITDIFGNVAGKTVLWVSLGIILLIAALELRFYGERVTTLMYYDIPYDAMMFFFAVVLLLVVKKGLSSSVRLCQVVSITVVVTFFLTFLFSLGNIKTENLMPITAMDALPILKGSVPSLCLFSFIIVMFFLTDYVNDLEKMKKKSMFFATLLTALLILVILVCVGILGPSLTSKMPYPYLTSVKMINLFESLERIESIVSAVTIVSDFTLIIMLIFAAVNILKHLLNLNNALQAANILIVLVYILAIFVGESKLELEYFSALILQPFFIVYTFGLVGSLMLVGRIRKKL